MIQRKTKVRRLEVELKASLRVLQQTKQIHLDQFKRTIHSIMSVGDVTRLWALIEKRDAAVRELCSGVGAEITSDDEAHLIAVLGSAAGEQTARKTIELAREIEAHISKWDDGRSLSRVQIEHYEATPITIRDRTLAHAYTAFCRQVEAHSELLQALLDAHYLQFWVLNGKYEFNGQPEDACGESK